MKRKWMVAAIVAVALTALAAGGAVLAGGLAGGKSVLVGGIGFGGKPEHHERLIAKAAAKLGVEATALESAHAQAVKDIENERRKSVLDDLVESGKLTREQADELNTWLEKRPDALDKVPGVGLAGQFGFFGKPPAQDDIYERIATTLGKDAAAVEQSFKDASQELGKELQLEAVQAQIDRLVENGTLTQQEADELKAWLADRPAVLSSGKLDPFGPLGPGFGPLFGHGPLHGEGEFHIKPELKEFFAEPFPGPEFKFEHEFRFHGPARPFRQNPIRPEREGEDGANFRFIVPGGPDFRTMPAPHPAPDTSVAPALRGA